MAVFGGIGKRLIGAFRPIGRRYGIRLGARGRGFFTRRTPGQLNRRVFQVPNRPTYRLPARRQVRWGRVAAAGGGLGLLGGLGMRRRRTRTVQFPRY